MTWLAAADGDVRAEPGAPHPPIQGFVGTHQTEEQLLQFRLAQERAGCR